MRIIDRAMIVLTSLVYGVLAVTIFSMLLSESFGDNVKNTIVTLYESQRLLAAGLFILFALAFIYMFNLGTRSHRHERFIVQETPLGELKISMTAIENLAKRAARDVKGVREVDAFVDGSEESITLNLTTLVAADVNIPQITEELERTLDAYIKSTVGIPISKITVFVKNTVNDVRSRVE